MGLDYARAKRRQAGRHGTPANPPRLSVQGWRIEYPQDFPVTVTRMATPNQTDSKMLSNLDQGQEAS